MAKPANAWSSPIRSRRRSSGAATRCALIDQRALPARLRFVDCRDVDALVDAIATLAVRGAPALGAAGAFGVALAARTLRTKRQVRSAAAARVAALAADRGQPRVGCRARARRVRARRTPTPRSRSAEAIAADDVRRNRRIGAHGAALVPVGGAVLTHCNAGALACVGLRHRARCGARRVRSRAGARRCGSTRPGRCCRARG